MYVSEKEQTLWTCAGDDEVTVAMKPLIMPYYLYIIIFPFSI